MKKPDKSETQALATLTEEVALEGEVMTAEEALESYPDLSEYHNDATYPHTRPSTIHSRLVEQRDVHFGENSGMDLAAGATYSRKRLKSAKDAMRKIEEEAAAAKSGKKSDDFSGLGDEMSIDLDA